MRLSQLAKDKSMLTAADSVSVGGENSACGMESGVVCLFGGGSIMQISYATGSCEKVVCGVEFVILIGGIG